MSFVNQFNSVSKKLLIQLPKFPKHSYSPFSTYSTILNFVREDIGTNIIQYHSDLNKQGHKTIKKSSLALKFIDENGFSSQDIKYHHTIQLGDKIWMIGSWLTDGKLAMSKYAKNNIAALGFGA